MDREGSGHPWGTTCSVRRVRKKQAEEGQDTGHSGRGRVSAKAQRQARLLESEKGTKLVRGGAREAGGRGQSRCTPTRPTEEFFSV